jgi:hypothetical protein
VSNLDKNRSPSNDTLSRDLVAVLIEKAIIEQKFHSLEKMQDRLKSKFDAGFADCYEHPEYLKETLSEFFKDYGDIIESVKNDLVDIVMNKDIRNFIRVLEE